MRWRRRNEMAEELKLTNSYLALIAEVIQKEPDRFSLRQPKVNVTVAPARIEKVTLPIQVTDAAELLARWLWLQLPEESKKDLMA